MTGGTYSSSSSHIIMGSTSSASELESEPDYSISSSAFSLSPNSLYISAPVFALRLFAKPLIDFDLLNLPAPIFLTSQTISHTYSSFASISTPNSSILKSCSYPGLLFKPNLKRP